ncbi:ADP-ribosyltransferase [Massilioclostridium coli]|uniref:ADP-ribosyltransferase n=1 Tax=Massilioclostridium coli TaxID=1870991 RepID=UPI003B838DDC
MDQYVADKVLTDDEEYSLKQYVSGKAYIINDKLRNNTPLNDEDEEYIHHLDNALRKMPKYQGNLNRSLLFDYDEDRKEFLKQYQKGKTKTYNEYISMTKDAIPYDASGQVQIYVIQSSRGRDISTYNKNELEVLYPRKSSFEILDVSVDDDGVTNIIMKEVITDAGKETIF